MKSKALNFIAWLTQSNTLFGKLFRFSGVGAIATILYVVLVSVFVELGALGSMFSAFLAYCCLLPMNFIAHRNFTFKSNGKIQSQIAKFTLLHGINLSLALGGMFLMVETLGLFYWIGSIVAAVLIPISSYLIMQSWIFKQQTSPHED